MASAVQTGFPAWTPGVRLGRTSWILVLGVCLGAMHSLRAGETGMGDSVPHWAFQPLAETRPPDAPGFGSEWIRTPLDSFIQARLRERGLFPSPPADRRTWLRRVTQDLIGLPPTYEELEAFAEDPRPDAKARQVERLLASPHYGERWGRHWLDLARYADNKGYVFFEDKQYPWAYTYRDYVIEAFNADKPYDRFVREQLAADLVAPQADANELRALGFLTVGGRFMNGLHDIIDDRIDVVTRGLLGLTVSCARCHDHKSDPITQADYYALYGVFRSTVEPVVPPEFLVPSDPAAHAAFQGELARRHGALETFIQDNHAALVRDGRDRAAEYLLAAQRRRAQPSTESFMLIAEKGDLNPTLIQRWDTFLSARLAAPDPAWLPWRLLSRRPEPWAELDWEVLAQGPLRVAHPLILARLLQRRPGSLAELATVYADAFREAAAEEEGQDDWAPFRSAFIGPDAPPNLPRMLDWGFLDLFPDRATQSAFKERLKAVETWLREGPAAPPRAMVLQEAEVPHEPRIFNRGNPHQPGAPVDRRFIAFLDPGAQPFRHGSGRLELARAITDPSTPLTARVWVNRIWQHHFGRGLVASASDFGRNTPPSTHPQLLDYLARRLMQAGWSTKALHREILLSHTYAQESRERPEAVRIDPTNRWHWRMNRRRLDFEGMRDALVFVTGDMDLRVGGPSVPVDGTEWGRRRAVYGYIDRLDLPELLRSFDFPDPSVSSPGRVETTVPQQSLFLMNHSFAEEAARRLVGHLGLGPATSPAAGVDRLYRTVLSRVPEPDEVGLARRFLERANDPAAGGARVWMAGLGRLAGDGQKVLDFQRLPHWTGSRWQGGPRLPDRRVGWLFLDARGGHPEKDLAIVRRWTAPRDGLLRLRGRLVHRATAGNGVEAVVLHSRKGLLGGWAAAHTECATDTSPVEVKQGDTLDFVVSALDNILHDEHEWVVDLELRSTHEAPETWNSEAGFFGPQLDPWSRLAQVLLMSNELAFVD